MFGLPIEATLLVFGFPLFWLIYTVIFLYRSRNWSDQDAPQDDGP